jgi:hypothetical protein
LGIPFYCTPPEVVSFVVTSGLHSVPRVTGMF